MTTDEKVTRRKLSPLSSSYSVGSVSAQMLPEPQAGVFSSIN